MAAWAADQALNTWTFGRNVRSRSNAALSIVIVLSEYYSNDAQSIMIVLSLHYSNSPKV